MRRKPKALIGFSDITALHMAIHTQVGLVSFHGPVAWRAFTPYTLGELRRVLCETNVPVRVSAPPPFEACEGQVDRENRVTTLVPGRARRRLLGGNLCLMAHNTLLASLDLAVRLPGHLGRRIGCPPNQRAEQRVLAPALAPAATPCHFPVRVLTESGTAPRRGPAREPCCGRIAPAFMATCARSDATALAPLALACRVHPLSQR
jgi:hypothetical protein